MTVLGSRAAWTAEGSELGMRIAPLAHVGIAEAATRSPYRMTRRSKAVVESFCRLHTHTEQQRDDSQLCF